MAFFRKTTALIPVIAVFLCARTASADPSAVSLDTVVSAVRQAEKTHPYLFANAAGFASVRAFATTNTLGQQALGRLCFEADQMLAFKPCERKLEGRRLLGVSRCALHRISVLAMAYRLTEKPVYRDRCVQEMQAVAAFSDWNPAHFLDVAEMTLALAVGYGWLYPDLDPSVRQTLASALLEKGLQTSLKHTGWVKASNNWGQVCHAGMLAGALALMDQQESLAATIAHRSITSLPRSMQAFAPKGSYPEGPGYWSYGTDFNVLALSLLEGVFKSDFGLSQQPGFRETADYLDTVTGPSGLTFNYADGGMSRGTDCATWWIALHLNRPDILTYFERDAFAEYCKNRTPLSPTREGHRLFAFTLFWLRPVPEHITPHAPLDWQSEGHVPIAIHRTSWDNAKALFVGLKAGSPSGPHGHMDAGSFVLDAEGIRWAYDLGAENYNRIESRKMDLWNSRQTSDRWRVFRLSSLSHNTLVIDGQLQLAQGTAKIVSFRSAPNAETVIDLSPVYTNASKVIRTGTLLPSGEFRLADSLTGLRPGACVRWGMVTKAAPHLPATGALTLTETGKRLTLTAEHDSGTAWKTYEVARPPNEWDSGNKGFVMIGFEAIAPESGELRLSVRFTPDGVQTSLSHVATVVK